MVLPFVKHSFYGMAEIGTLAFLPYWSLFRGGVGR